HGTIAKSFLPTMESMKVLPISGDASEVAAPARPSSSRAAISFPFPRRCGMNSFSALGIVVPEPHYQRNEPSLPRQGDQTFAVGLHRDIAGEHLTFDHDGFYVVVTQILGNL